MNSSPAWLEGLARGAARAQVRRRTSRPEADWGERRFSRRTVMGTAVTTVAAASVLRHVTPASAEFACVKPCIKDAADDLAKLPRICDDTYGPKIDALNRKIAQRQAELGKVRTQGKRAAVQSVIDDLARQVQGQLNRQTDCLLTGDVLFQHAVDRCRSDNQCGDPATYPDPSGGVVRPPAGSSGCPNGTITCPGGAICCAGGSICCGCAATGGQICCISEVGCACCPN